jgi:hypothetical protein
MLEGVPALRYSYEDVGTPFMGDLCDCHELGPDGYMDLVVHFDRQAIYATMGAVTDGEYRQLNLTAEHYNGGVFEGADCVWIKHKVQNQPPPPPRIFTRTFGGSDTQIQLSLGEATDVSLVVYDVLGKRVKSLVNGTMPAGDHTIQWDGRDDAGRAVADGVYFANVQAGSVQETAKMIFMK